jgi:hypothetical protein
MAVSLPKLIRSSVVEGVSTGVENAVTRQVKAFIRPGIPEKVGFAVGAIILGTGYYINARHKEMSRIKKIAEELEVE